jgi:hypothetical protein
MFNPTDANSNFVSLRDYFATQILNGICSSNNNFITDKEQYRRYIETAYEISDIMLSVRNEVE